MARLNYTWYNCKDGCPCKLCTQETGRYPGCHSHCEKYIEYKKEIDHRRNDLIDACKSSDLYKNYAISKGDRLRKRNQNAIKGVKRSD